MDIALHLRNTLPNVFESTGLEIVPQGTSYDLF